MAGRTATVSPGEAPRPATAQGADPVSGGAWAWALVGVAQPRRLSVRPPPLSDPPHLQSPPSSNLTRGASDLPKGR